MLKILSLVLFIVSLNAAIIDGVAIKIGDEIITIYDIKKEMQLSHTTKEQAKEILIRKKLEALEIKKRNIEVSDDEVYNEIRRLARANNMTISQFYDIVREKNGLSSSELKQKIKERLLSQKLYQAISFSKLNEPDEKEIEAYFNLHKDKFSRPSFIDVIAYSSSDKNLLEQKMQNPMFYSASILQQEQRLDTTRISPQLLNILLRTNENRFTPILPNKKNGFMTFYVKKIAKPSEVKLDDVKMDVINEIMAQKRAVILDDYFAKLKDNIDIKYIRD